MKFDRVDRELSLVSGIGCAAVVLWSAYQLFWSIDVAMTYDGLFAPMMWQAVLCGVIAVAAVIAAAGFLTRSRTAQQLQSCPCQARTPCQTATPAMARPIAGSIHQPRAQKPVIARPASTPAACAAHR